MGIVPTVTCCRNQARKKMFLLLVINGVTHPDKLISIFPNLFDLNQDFYEGVMHQKSKHKKVPLLAGENYLAEMTRSKTNVFLGLK